MQMRQVDPRFTPSPFEQPRFTPPPFDQPQFQAPALEQQVISPRPRLETQPQTLELPDYEGGNPDDWLFRVEQCFLQHHIPDSEKLEKVISCLTGAAVTWWRYSKEREAIYTWKDFQDKFKTRFRPSRGSSAVDHLLNIRQSRSVDEYRDIFEELIVELPHVTTDVLESAFLNGLRRTLKDQVVRFRPVNLTDIVEIARLIESQERDSLSYQVRSQLRPAQTTNQLPSTSRSNERAQSKRPYEAHTDTNRASGSVHTNTGEVRNSNPCTNCGDKWFPGHHCRQQKLKSLEVAEEEEQEGPSGEAGVEQDPTEDQEEEEGFVTLNLGSMSDLTKEEKSMKLRGYIGPANVVVLVDSGATSNFINERLSRAMGWPITQTRGFGVRVGEGRIIRSRGKCVDVPLEIQRIEITDDFLLFDLGELDAVLGFTWLANLGETRANWGHLRLSWQIGDVWVTIHGDPELCREQVSLHSMKKVIKQTKGEAYLLELSSLFEKQHQGSQRAPSKEIQRILEQYQKVFSIPNTHPPARNREHAITLQEGTASINLRPYMYSFDQKNEIEKMVKEMMDAQIIKPSVSPYSSPVLLVKKKDGGWPFCVDYRALNQATVPDRYPILVIEELLDELGGAAVFSKLDLRSGYHQIRVKSIDVEKWPLKHTRATTNSC